MKRILFGVIVMLAFIESVWADTSLYRYQYSDGVNTYIKEFSNIGNEFDLYLDNNVVEISNYQKIHNIAYYGYNNETYQKIIAQVMIWEEVYPGYSFQILDNTGNIVDLAYYRRNANRFLNNHNRICDLDGLVSDVSYGGSVTYVSNYNMESYVADKFFVSASGKLIILDNITGIGTHTIHFTVKERINNNKIIASGPSFGDFTTTINYLGNRITIDSNNLAFIFDMYNLDTNELIGTYFIDQYNNYIEYPYGINVILIDNTSSTEYEKMADIIINENDTHTYNINLKPNITNKTISFKAPLINENYNIINIDIYNTNNELINEVRCNRTCHVDLPRDSYKLINNNTLEEYDIILDHDIEFNLSNNYLIALISEYPITEIIYDDRVINYIVEDNYIYLNDYISSAIKVKIEDNYYDITLNNLEYVAGMGLVKRLNIDLIPKEEVTEKEIINQDYVEIDIPNTEDNNVIWGEYYVKKKYYSSYYSSINNYF